MSEREWKRLDGVGRVEAGLLSNGEAATVLGISARQMRRVRERVGELGHSGVQHGNTGRAPVNRVGEQVRARVVELRLDKYQGINDQHFTEKLAEVEGMVLSRPTVRRMLRAAGIRSKRQRRAPAHRRRRARRAQAGMMILWDGSQHPWLEERGPQLCLMGALDDATGELLEGAHFVAQECAAGYARSARRLPPPLTEWRRGDWLGSLGGRRRVRICQPTPRHQRRRQRLLNRARRDLGLGGFPCAPFACQPVALN